jgi:pyridoxine 5-phosphate synthase
MMAKLCLNVDSVTSLRSTRKTSCPDPVAVAILAELAGASGVVIHLPSERHHIQDRDARILRHVVQTTLTLKLGCTPETAGIALHIKPDFVTLAPEKREEFTTEGGLDLIVHKSLVSDAIRPLQDGGIFVSILIDPDPGQLKVAHQLNADMVDIHTGTYCDATTSIRKTQAFSKIVDTVKLAHKLKMGVNVGHGLCYNTIKAFKGLPEIDMFCIGHSIISRAVLVGMEKAIKEMLALIKELT